MKCNTNVNTNVNKVCVKKGAGGHGNETMINHVINSKEVACGKIYDDREYNFYETVFRLSNQPNLKILQKYLPKWYSMVCEYHGHKYFVFENLAPEKDAVIMDLKIGHVTSDTKKYFKRMRHYVLDNFFSLSSKYGIRLEGANFPLIGQTEQMIKLPGKEKYRLYGYTPSEIINSFIKATGKNSKRVIREIARQINEIMVGVLIPNLSILEKRKTRKMGFGLMGTSLLIISTSNKTTVKLIDFANSTIITKFSSDEEVEKSIREMKDFIMSLDGFLKILNQWL